MKKVKKKAKEKNKGGRPTKFKDEYTSQVYVACAEGMTDKKLCKLFGVAESTLNLWKLEHEEFRAEYERGKDYFQTQVVEKSLLKRAQGFSYTETTEQKNPTTGEVELFKKVKKLFPPDTGAICFYLKNIAPSRWKERQEVELTGLDRLGERLANAHKRVDGGSKEKD